DGAGAGATGAAARTCPRTDARRQPTTAGDRADEEDRSHELSHDRGDSKPCASGTRGNPVRRGARPAGSPAQIARTRPASAIGRAERSRSRAIAAGAPV